MTAPCGNGRKAVAAKDVKKRIEQGLEYVGNLPDGSVVVKLPV